MTIIDDYIDNNKHRLTDREMSVALGCSESSVAQKRRLIESRIRHVTTFSMHDYEEVKALICLINDRQTGWAVDVAKARVRELERLNNLIK